MVVYLTRTAQRQRAAILKYRAEVAGRRSASELRAEFKAAIELIGGWAPPGVSRSDLAPAKYQFVLVKPYWVIWRFDENGDRVIVAFADARRDIPSMKFD
jgi:plasmid stabilization system protein ParE